MVLYEKLSNISTLLVVGVVPATEIIPAGMTENRYYITCQPTHSCTVL